MVTGSYDSDKGTILANVQDDRITGTWKWGSRSGPLEFVLSADKSSFVGRWAYAPDNLKNAGTRVARCLESAVRSAPFPSFTGNPIDFRYPFVLGAR